MREGGGWGWRGRGRGRSDAGGGVGWGGRGRGREGMFVRRKEGWVPKHLSLGAYPDPKPNLEPRVAWVGGMSE